MADFRLAIGVILDHEGGYSDDPNDPGGETNMGITKRDFPQEDIRNMTVERASELYHFHYWDELGLDRIVYQPVATKLMDMAVNTGTRTAVRLLQRALNYILKGQPLAVDGVLGPRTVEAANSIPDQQLLILALRAYHAYRYIEIVEGPDPRYDRFSKNWLKRSMA